MAAYLRLRQICLAAPSLGPAEAAITTILGMPVTFRDVNVGPYGLENAIFPLGPDVLEVVAPTREGTAVGRFLERTGGRGGYMVILDCDDPEARRAHAETLGVRAANVIDHDGYHGVQLHPRDCRAAMIEFNHTTGGEALGGPYHPAGPDWPVAAGRHLALLEAELETADAAGLAQHWARILQREPVPAAGGWRIALDHGAIRIRQGAPDCPEVLSGLAIGASDPLALRQAAIAGGKLQPDGTIALCGVSIRVSPQGVKEFVG